MINALITEIESRGYRVCWHTGGVKAVWLPQHGAISVRYGMSDAATVSSLAHEFGHAMYGHPGGCHPAHEWQADRFAARLLIDPAAYARCENEYGPHPALLARELGVTTHVIEVFRSLPSCAPGAR